jgi:nicotinic acid mononucleotide adenylyltransferase
MGSDVFARLSHWPRVDDLITSAMFVVGVRDGGDNKDFHEHLAMIEKTRHLKLQYRTFPSVLPGESSTKIRQSLRHGKIPAGLDPLVSKYIQQHSLYSSEYSE